MGNKSKYQANQNKARGRGTAWRKMSSKIRHPTLEIPSGQQTPPLIFLQQEMTPTMTPTPCPPSTSMDNATFCNFCLHTSHHAEYYQLIEATYNILTEPSNRNTRMHPHRRSHTLKCSPYQPPNSRPPKRNSAKLASIPVQWSIIRSGQPCQTEAVRSTASGKIRRS